MNIKERIYIIGCPQCKNKQQTIVRGKNGIEKKSRKCVYCGKNISLSKMNRIKRIQ